MNADDLFDSIVYHARQIEHNELKSNMIGRGDKDYVLLIENSKRKLDKLRNELRTRLVEKN